MNGCITIWNRKEVCLTRDLNKMNAVHNILSKHGIDYITRTNSITNLGRYHGTLSIKADYAYEYRIYIHKRDYEFVKDLLR